MSHEGLWPEFLLGLWVFAGLIVPPGGDTSAFWFRNPNKRIKFHFLPVRALRRQFAVIWHFSFRVLLVSRFYPASLDRSLRKWMQQELEKFLIQELFLGLKPKKVASPRYLNPVGVCPLGGSHWPTISHLHHHMSRDVKESSKICCFCSLSSWDPWEGRVRKGARHKNVPNQIWDASLLQSLVNKETAERRSCHQISSRWGIGTEVLDSSLHHHRQNTKWGNIFVWKAFSPRVEFRLRCTSKLFSEWSNILPRDFFFNMRKRSVSWLIKHYFADGLFQMLQIQLEWWFNEDFGVLSFHM